MEATEMIFTADGRRLDVLLSETSGLSRSRVAALMEQGFSRKDAVKQTAKELDMPKNAVYEAALKIPE